MTARKTRKTITVPTPVAPPARLALIAVGLRTEVGEDYVQDLLTHAEQELVRMLRDGDALFDTSMTAVENIIAERLCGERAERYATNLATVDAVTAALGNFHNDRDVQADIFDLRMAEVDAAMALGLVAGLLLAGSGK